MFKWLARAFTIPKAVRQKLDANPIIASEKGAVLSAVTSAAFAALDANVSDPLAAVAAKQALPYVLDHIGLGQ